MIQDWTFYRRLNVLYQDLNLFSENLMLIPKKTFLNKIRYLCKEMKFLRQKYTICIEIEKFMLTYKNFCLHINNNSKKLMGFTKLLKISLFDEQIYNQKYFPNILKYPKIFSILLRGACPLCPL